MQRNVSPSLALGLSILLGSIGCASTGEKQLRQRLDVVQDSLLVQEPGAGPPEPQTASQLPLDASLGALRLHAVRHNDAVAAAFESWRAAVEHIPQVRALADPQLHYGYYIRAVETRVGPQRHRFSLSQIFPWFGKLGAQGDAALEAAGAAEQDFRRARLRLFYELDRAYAELYYTTRAQAVTQANLDLLLSWEEVARARFRAGRGTHADVIKAQVEIGVLSDRIRNLEDQRGVRLADVNVLLDRAPDAPLAVPDTLRDEAIDQPDDELIAMLDQASPELLALDHTVASRQHEVRRASKSGLPDLRLGADYIVTGEAIAPDVPDTGQDAVIATFSINLPLWRGKYAAEEREAQARLRAARYTRSDVGKRLVADVKRVAFEARDAGRRTRLYRDTLIPKGEQSLRAASTAFEAGRLEFLNVVEAQRVLLEFQLAYERALSDQLARTAELEMRLGRELERSNAERAAPAGADQKEPK
ncbi:MAG: TolC family protein [Candidatus Latescibacterota bacterium]|nr:MAG: TolC family protein [Candidatus Latescibacterota bacterium]